MKSSLSSQVYVALLEKLLKNELVPGIILNRREVAAELGVSVAPVLEAMLHLEMEGFLESIPRKGTQVKPVIPEDVRGHLVVREALECQAARIYCGEAVKKNEARLLKLARKADQTPPDTVEHWRRELEFHNALIELTNITTLIKEYNRIMKVNVFYGLNRIVTNLDGDDIHLHRELVELLKTNDPDKAERIMRKHARTGEKGFVIEGLR
ncbi:MAG TPA: GntR family transcriptional regulator [Spirochaetia bacterium]|nr:GntR family transcriptional regulator [Spirochaetia bacterium]